jgi:tetratricopeptide (TPR) repeat protein
VLYELESLQHDAMSLGHYILSSAGGYETLKAWTKFHIGNIWLDFENPPNARDQFEEAMDWALNTGFPYAVMTFYERLALANMRLGKLSLAEKYYEESQKQAKENDIKPELVMKNDIRCKIGLGNLRYRKAESELGDPKESACQAADQYFKQALTLIAQTNYPANRKVSLVNLSELYKLWRGPNDPDAKNYLDLANQ